MNIIDGFLLHAKHQPTVAAICAPGWNYNIVSYGRLLVFANNAAAHALAAGLKRGDVVGILARDPIFHWALVLGLTQVGIVSFSLHDANVPAGFRDSVSALVGIAVPPVVRYRPRLPSCGSPSGARLR